MDRRPIRLDVFCIENTTNYSRNICPRNSVVTGKHADKFT